MAEHDYVIANQNGANTRSDLNNALAAIVSNNSKASAPTTTYAFMWWADTANDILKQRNGADSAWISILTLSTGAPLGALAASLVSGTHTNFTSTGIDDNATSTALEITTDGRGLSPFTARVWVVISGAGAIVDSHNISSTTRNATGDFTMTFANNLNNATYSRVGSTNDEGGSNGGDIGLLSFGTPTVSSLRIETGYLATSGSLVHWSFTTSTVIFGD